MIKSILASVTNSLRDSLKTNPEPSVEIPLFPLGSVLFPGGTMALKIFEQRYLEMAKTSLRTGSPFGIALIREGEEVGIPAVSESIGTIAHVTDWDMQNLGVLQLRVKGTERFQLLSQSISRNGLITGEISILPNDMHIDCPEHTACAEFLRNIFAQTSADSTPDEQRFDDAGWVGFRLTELLPFNSAIKQKMLELTDARIRLEIIYRFLKDQQLIG